MIDVLVVDDDFMVARIHSKFIERTDGFRVIATAHNGADALALTERLQPDLLLLDVHLPDLSGLEVLSRLRARGNVTAVVMVTAERDAEAVRAALHLGALQYIVKPFEYDDLAQRLHRVRDTLASLPSGDADQASIDRAFGGPGPGGVTLPKGLSQVTADLVLASLGDGEELSAVECADRLGLSRVTARRYLEHFVETGEAEVRLNYGGAGRPEHRYRSAR